MELKEIRISNIDKYVKIRGIENIKGSISRDVYDDYLQLMNRPIGYIEFRKILMSRYNLSDYQIKSGNKRVRIFI